MKKLIALLLLVVVLCTMLCACSTTYCDMCSKEITGKKYTHHIMGTKVTVCESCHKYNGAYFD